MNPDDLARLKATVAEIGNTFNSLGPDALMRIALEHERNVQLQRIGDKLESLYIEVENLNNILRNRS